MRSWVPFWRNGSGFLQVQVRMCMKQTIRACVQTGLEADSHDKVDKIYRRPNWRASSVHQRLPGPMMWGLSVCVAAHLFCLTTTDTTILSLPLVILPPKNQEVHSFEIDYGSTIVTTRRLSSLRFQLLVLPQKILVVTKVCEPRIHLRVERVILLSVLLCKRRREMNHFAMR